MVTVWGHWSFSLVSCASSCDCICSNTNSHTIAEFAEPTTGTNVPVYSGSISTHLGSDKWAVIKVKLGSDHGIHLVAIGYS